MKLEINIEKVESGGITEEGEFKLKSSAKAFAILSSGLYSNKYIAIIRELSCNAIDSHVEADKADVPFTIHLPNRLEPYLSIQDYGIGLDNKGVTDVYTTYFESTKTDSNDYIGALGLGSKSPFSYTNNFTITAIYNGVKRLYGCYLNDSGIPSFAKMGADADTDECNGVEVRFAVAEEDFNKWDSAVCDTLKWFTNKPTIVGRVITIPEINYVDTGDVIEGIRIRKSNSRNEKPIAIMGNVAYPIDPPVLDIPETFRGLLDIPFVINFDIGELAFTPSREELQYSPTTLANIINKLEQVFEKFAEHARGEILAGKSTWDKVVIADKLMQEPVYQNVVKGVIKEINDKSHYHIEVRNGIVGIVVPIDKIQHHRDGEVEISGHRLRSARRWKAKDSYVKESLPNELFGSSRGGIKIFIDDLKRGGPGRLKQAVRDENGAHKLNSGKTVVSLKVGADNDRAIHRISRLFGGMKFVRTSSLPRVIYHSSYSGGQSRVPGEKINFLSLYFEDGGSWRATWKWSGNSSNLKDYLDEQEYVYYVTLKNKTVLRDGQPVDSDHWNNFVALLKGSNFLDENTPIIGVRRQNVNSLTPKCIDLFKFVENRLKEFTARRMQRTKVYSEALDACLYDIDVLENIVKDIPKSSSFTKFVKKVLAGQKRNNDGTDVGTLVKLSVWIHGSNKYQSLDVVKAKEEGRKLWDNVIDRYSFLRWTSNHTYGNQQKLLVKEVAKYIKLVDTIAKLEDNSVIELEVN